MSQANPYPNIGFNPVPGMPDDVSGLRTQINSAGTAVKETNDLLKRLRNSNDDIWKGDAGDAFRSHFDNTLAQDLGYAQNSLERAVTVLDEWHTGLVGYQDTAKTLETEAAEARGKHAKAVTALREAKSNPDLGLANQTFTDQNALAAAQSRLNTAEAAVRTAGASVDNYQGEIDSILKRAKDLESEHGKLARKVAAELDAAAKDFAPSAPNHHWWDSITDAVQAVGKWISDHRKQIHDILAGISAVTGLLALLTPPPADAIFGAIALVSGLGALGTDFADPSVRKAFGDFVSDASDGKFNGDALKKIGTTVGADSLAILPGAGGTFKGLRALSKVGELDTAVKAFAEGAQSPGIMTKALNRIPRPGSATVWLQDFSEANRWAPGAGTALSGLELASRSAKGALGLDKIGNSLFGDKK
ncbi:hypothetical protein [Nocardia miyunensis]|uniref:hypothetical protein n=1 Tax=Nocardia miyunensis TaxID=282684 RepID=UPI00082FBE75|nr:hypothetical protein [Nocardia miyunensis]